MEPISTALGVIELINKLFPVGVGLILKFRDENGTETVLNTLDNVKKDAQANIDEMKAHIEKIKAGQQ